MAQDHRAQDRKVVPHIDRDDNESYQHRSSPFERCFMCPNVALKHCAACQEAYYCCKDCQVKDWPFHRMICRQVDRFSDANRPSKSHYRILVFPPRAKTAHFAWFDTSMVLAEMERLLTSRAMHAVYSSAHIATYLPPAGRRQWPDYHMAIVGHRYHRPHPLSPVNEWISKLQGAAGRGMIWWGRTLVLGCVESADAIAPLVGRTFYDTCVRDFREAIDIFRTNYLNPCYPLRELGAKLPRFFNILPALKLNSPADMELLRPVGLTRDLEDVFTRTRLPDTDLPTGERHAYYASFWPTVLGLPWYVRKAASHRLCDSTCRGGNALHSHPLTIWLYPYLRGVRADGTNECTACTAHLRGEAEPARERVARQEAATREKEEEEMNRLDPGGCVQCARDDYCSGRGYHLHNFLDRHCFTLLLARADGRVVSKAHLRAFTAYMSTFLPQFEAWSFPHPGDILAKRDDVCRLVTRAGFDTFWDWFKGRYQHRYRGELLSPYHEVDLRGMHPLDLDVPHEDLVRRMREDGWLV